MIQTEEGHKEKRRFVHHAIHSIKCLGCGMHFMAKRSTAKYCGWDCFGKNQIVTEAMRESGRRACSIGVKFAKRPWDGAKRPEFSGARHPMFGRKHSIPTREIISSKTKEAHKVGVYDHITPEVRSIQMLGKNRREGTELRRAIRSCFKMTAWKKYVLRRDRFTCQGCLRVGGTLEVHHVKRFYTIVVSSGIKTLDDALSCAELWDTSNGVALCIPCHNKTKFRVKNK